jgi:hypothetical protein
MAYIKTATEGAIAFAQAALGAERTRGIRLEEIESTTVEGEDAWLITLSMLIPVQEDPINNIAGMISAFGKRQREYKTFTVLKRNGEVISMKIRELADA